MKKIFICLAILCVLVSCKKEKREKMNDSLNIVSNKELLKGWKVFANDSVKINIPNNWKTQKVNNVLLYVPLDKNKANLYFAILKTDTTVVNVKNYLKEVFKQMSEKDNKFSYLLTKVTFENGTNCYKLDIYINVKGIKYKVYCLLYQKNNLIYDFSYKCLNNEETNIDNYRIFYNALFSFKYKDSIIIDSENFIVKNEEVMKYEDL